MSQASDTQGTRAQVAAAARRLADRGLVLGTAGNVSARAGEDLIAITPTGGRLEALEPDDISVVDRRGEQVEGVLAPTSELALHLGVYERYGAGGVIHTHAPHATALACVLEGELPLVHYAMLALGGTVRVAPYRTFGTPELAEATLGALEGRNAALMANHGTINYAHDLDTAVDNALLLEWACELYSHAAAVGTPRALSEAEQQAVIEQVLSSGYGKPRSHSGT